MHGLLIFSDLATAIKAGYQVYQVIPEGYLVRTRTSSGWALAVVHCSTRGTRAR